MNRLTRENGARVGIYEASLLVETGRHESLSGLIVVESPRNLRKTTPIFTRPESPQKSPKAS